MKRLRNLFVVGALGLVFLIGMLAHGVYAFADAPNDIPGATENLEFVVSETLTNPGDTEDVFAVWLEKGEDLKVTMSGSTDGPDYNVWLYRPSATHVGISADFARGVRGNNGVCTLVSGAVPEAGWYEINAWCDVDDQAQGTVSYSLHAWLIPAPYKLSKISAPKTATANKWFNAHVTLRPYYYPDGKPVTFSAYRKERGTWVHKLSSTVGQMTVVAPGVSTFGVRVKMARGTWRLRASFADNWHPRRWTKYKTVTVK